MAFKIALNPVHHVIDVLAVVEEIKSESKRNIEISWNKTWNDESDVCLYDEADKLLGQHNNEITRYLARTMHPLLYGGNCPFKRTEVDHWISCAILLQNEATKELLSYLNDVLITRTWLVTKRLTLADIHMFCVLHRHEYIKLYAENYCNITRWYKLIESLPAVNNAISMIAKNCPPSSKSKGTDPQKEKSAAKQTKTRKQEGKFIDLPGAEMGKVVVRFPPEASGYLHIGHAKAALLNQYYAEAFQGELIMRFDDTNPAKETVEFEEAILEDLKLLQIKPNRFTHTSDHFSTLQECCAILIRDNKAYLDATPANLMKEQRDQRLKSKYRDLSVSENMKLWEEMIRGTEIGRKYCVRAKIDYQSTNGCMRDPTIYRCKLEPHPRTGTKYKVYPTYDFACPIVDFIEHVTHTLRTTEYHDRDAQFYWILDTLGLRRPYIWEYSRLNMTHTVLSKRKLTWFVNKGLVDGWDDPRFPTVRGILRRGMTVEGLKEFIIAQGSSRSVVFMEWDKIWAFNKKFIDPVAIRYTALDYNTVIPVNVVDAKEEWLTVQNHPKDSSIGTKRVRVNSKILIEKEDAENLIEGQNATFINWGNLMIQKINKQDGNIVSVEARLNLEDKNYKNTLKLTWLAESLSTSDPNAEKSNPITCYAVYFDHIIRVPVLGKDDDFQNFVATNTRKEIRMLGEVELKRVKKGDIIQLQRKGFFICDVPYASNSFSLREQPIILFHIPDGHTKTPYMTAVSHNGLQQEDKVQHMETYYMIYRNPLEKIEEAIDKYDKTKILDPCWKNRIQSLMQEAGLVIPYDAVSETLRIAIDSMLYPLYLQEDNEEGNEDVYTDVEDYFKYLLQMQYLRTERWSLIHHTIITQNFRDYNEYLTVSITRQIDKVQFLKNLKADKKKIDHAEKILSELKKEYEIIFQNSIETVDDRVDWEPLKSEPSEDLNKDTGVQEALERYKTQGYTKEYIDYIMDFQNDMFQYLKIAQECMFGKVEWIDGPTGPMKDRVAYRERRGELIARKVNKQIREIRNLRSSNAEKSIIEPELKVLITLKLDYTIATGRVRPLDKVKSEAEKLFEEMKEQADKLQKLIKSNADKKIIDQEMKFLLSLKSDYENATKQDRESVDTKIVNNESETKPENKDISEAEKISEEIKKQGDKVRNLKSSKVDKSIIDQEVKVLLALKNDYKNVTGQDWKPTDTKVASNESKTKPENKDISEAEKISEEIKKQGDKVRNLKSSKVDKSIIDQEVKVLLGLKNDYKNATGQDWKPTDTKVASNKSKTKPENKDISEAEKISEEIQKQGDKVRNLKSSKVDKSIIDQEVKVLLSLKNDYKNATGQDWKPTDTKVASNESKTKPENKDISEAEKISEEINKQGNKVRNLKSSKVDKSIIDQEVKVLLSLKNDYKNATGQDWKPTDTKVASNESKTKPENKDISEAEKISEEIQKQGDKVRNLKSSKVDKSIIDQEVKVLLSLKNDYKNATGQDWKPTDTKVASNESKTKPENKDISEAEKISEEINKQGNKVRNLKSSKVDKSIIDQEVKVLLALKNDYKNATGQDWKPADTKVVSSQRKTKPENKEISEKISEEIKKQGDKVRNLKSSKVDKSIIDQEVKVLLGLKNVYKNATGQDWKPANSEAASKEVKQNTQTPEKTSEKEVAKNANSKDTGSSKTGTRLGLEAKKEENFNDWYSQVITKSGMIEYYDVSGCYILRPWSFSIWKIIKEYIDREITDSGVQECYFPIFVTRSVLEKEKAHIADFAPEVAWVTKYGENDLAEPIAIRPTSETIMYPAYAKWLRSDTELPLRLNQWNNVVRWEFKDPKPFLRTREFLWQEGHTAFATESEAESEVLMILDLYARVYENLLAVPVVKGRKTEKEKFAGGVYTTTVEAFISTNGRAIQGATSHHLGQNFSKMFNIQVEGILTGEKSFVYQNSWGLTTRTIGVMIMVHGDDQGLVLPPAVAPVQIIVIPCGIAANMDDSVKENLLKKCSWLVDQLREVGKFRVQADCRLNRTPGWKFNHWELKGVPVRLELGPIDLRKNQVTIVRRDNFERTAIKMSEDLITSITSIVNDVQQQLLSRARSKLNEHIKQVETWSDFNLELNKKNLLLSPFCGEPACEDKIKEDSTGENAESGSVMGAKSLCIPFTQPKLTKPLDELKCIHHSCENKPKFYTLFGRSY